MLDLIFPSVSSIAAVTLLSAVSGLLLSIALLKLRVEKDPCIERIAEALPGANCGACGLPGCSAYATRIVEEKYRIDLCVVGGSDTARKIAQIMGVESPEALVAKTARIRCQGGIAQTARRFNYGGLAECAGANGVMGGFKVCRYGCLGFGDCMRACPFDAIMMSANGLPVVDYEACTGCGLCVTACPRHIIELAPRQNDIHVLCSNREKAALMKAGCSVGCIACKLCEKACRRALSAKYPEQNPMQIELAVQVDNFLANINYTRCIQCYECVAVCPVPVIDPTGKSTKVLQSGDASAAQESTDKTIELPA